MLRLPALADTRRHLPQLEQQLLQLIALQGPGDHPQGLGCRLAHWGGHLRRGTGPQGLSQVMAISQTMLIGQSQARAAATDATCTLRHATPRSTRLGVLDVRQPVDGQNHAQPHNAVLHPHSVAAGLLRGHGGVGTVRKHQPRPCVMGNKGAIASNSPITGRHVNRGGYIC